MSQGDTSKCKEDKLETLSCDPTATELPVLSKIKVVLRHFLISRAILLTTSHIHKPFSYTTFLCLKSRQTEVMLCSLHPSEKSEIKRWWRGERSGNREIRLLLPGRSSNWHHISSRWPKTEIVNFQKQLLLHTSIPFQTVLHSEFHQWPRSSRWTQSKHLVPRVFWFLLACWHRPNKTSTQRKTLFRTLFEWRNPTAIPKKVVLKII